MSFEIRIFVDRKCSSIMHRPKVHYYYSLLSSNHNQTWKHPEFLCSSCFSLCFYLLCRGIQCVKSFFFITNTEYSIRPIHVEKRLLRLQYMKLMSKWWVLKCQGMHMISIFCAFAACYYYWSEELILISLIDIISVCVFGNIPFMVVNEIIFKQINFYCVHSKLRLVGSKWALNFYWYFSIDSMSFRIDFYVRNSL